MNAHPSLGGPRLHGASRGRTSRWAAAAALGLLLAASPAAAYTVVLETGGRLEVREIPVYDATGHARVTTPDGRSLLLPRSAVSASSTAAANRTRTAPSRPIRVWSNADLEALRGRRVQVVGVPSEPSAPALTAPSPSETGDAGEEAAWRAQGAALRQRVAHLEAAAAALDRADSSWEGYVIGTGSYQGEIAGAAASRLSEIRAKRAQAEAELQQARGELSVLHERARVARVPPGWLR